jgi:hypothetical protein
MRDQGITQGAVMRLYQRLHRRWRRLQKARPTSDTRWESAQTESAVRALAWVLGLDPESETGTLHRYYSVGAMTSPDGRPPLTGVRLTRAWDGGGKVGWYWVLEVPARIQDDGKTETVYWAAMVAQRQVQELALAFGKAFYESEPTKELDVIMASQNIADQPTVTDLRALIASVEWSVMERQTGGAA